MKRLVTELFLAQNFSPKPGVTPGTGNIRAMDCDQIKDRYFVDILGITNTGHRCPSQDEIVNAQMPQLGNFVGLGFFHYFWRGLHQLADGRVLVTTYQDGTGIYKVENDALSWFQNDNRNYWTDICQLNNSDVLATSYGKIYKKINDLGDFAEFISLSQNWSTICAASTGGAIACVFGGDVYLISGSG